MESLVSDLYVGVSEGCGMLYGEKTYAENTRNFARGESRWRDSYDIIATEIWNVSECNNDFVAAIHMALSRNIAIFSVIISLLSMEALHDFTRFIVGIYVVEILPLTKTKE